MTRAEAIAELGKFQALATVANCDTGDAKPGFGQAIDSALRELDFTQSQLSAAVVDDDDVRAYLALLDYFALKLLRTHLVPLVDLSTAAGDGKADEKLSQMFRMAGEMLAEAKDEVKRLGYLDSDFELVNFNTNFIEPASAEI